LSHHVLFRRLISVSQSALYISARPFTQPITKVPLSRSL